MAGFLTSLGFGKRVEIPFAAEVRSITNRGSLSFDNWSTYGSGTFSGENVNPQNALTNSVVYASFNIIADSIALLPRSIKQRTAKGNTFAANHPVNLLYQTEPNPFMTWYTLMHAWIVNSLRWGNGFIQIHRNGVGRPNRFQLLENHECQIYYVKNLGVETLWYYVHGKMIPPRDILHISCLGSNGVEGDSIITLMAESIGLNVAAIKTMAKFYKSGLKTKAVFTSPEMLDDESFGHLKNQIQDNLNDDFFLLEGGTAATSLQMSPQDAEILSTRKFQIEDFARVLRVPLAKLGISGNTSVGNSLSEQNIDFETDCILPWAERIEQELNRKLLLPSEKLTYYHNLDENHIRRMDVTKRVDYYHKRWLIGSITSNQVRVLENELTMDNELMDTPFAQSGTVPMSPKYWDNKNLDNTLKNNENSGEQSSDGSGSD